MSPQPPPPLHTCPFSTLEIMFRSTNESRKIPGPAACVTAGGGGGGGGGLIV